MSRRVKTKFSTKRIADFVKLHQRRLLNLSPGFQRKSVWGEKDRKKLIRSIFEGYPVPSVFLYKRVDQRGRNVYDVLDGKQRLESVFAYCRLRGFNRQGFGVGFQFKGLPHPDDEEYDWTWRDLKVWRRQHRLLDYKLQVVEVGGELADIQELFVRINSTGKKLSNQERRRAQYIMSPVLSEAERLAARLAKRLSEDRIVSASQRLRMKDVELMCELLLTFFHGGPINKKAAVDAAMSGQGINLHSVRKAARGVVRIYKLARTILPEMKSTRFKNHSEFYSLVTTLHQLSQRDLDLSDRRGQRIAERLLHRLGSDANRAQEERRRLKTITIKPVVRDYLMAVEQGADAVGQRVKRQAILTALLGNLFSERDRRRLFTPQQRELVWSSMQGRRCVGRRNGKRCNRRLNWHSFQVDHIRPWSKGGKTDLTNARGLCPRCNASKGNRLPRAHR